MRKFCAVLLAAHLTLSTLLTLSISAADAPLRLSARRAVLYEPVTETCLVDRNADERAPMASTTKIMTALITIEAGDLDRTVEIPAEACGVEGSSIYMTAGEHLTVRELLYALLLQSANDAALALAIAVDGTVDDFVARMNDRADALSLTDTHFDNPHGLDSPRHYTTARELARIAAAALELPDFREIVSTVKYTIPHGDDGDCRVLVNHNRLLRLYPDAIGVKTGFTKKSGRCLVGAACRDDLTLISVTLDAPNDWQDHKALLDYGFTRFENRLLTSCGEFTAEIPVIGQRPSTCLCTNAEEAHGILPVDAEAPEARIALPHFFVTQPKDGSVVGSLAYYYKGRKICEVSLIARSPYSIPESWKR